MQSAIKLGAKSRLLNHPFVDLGKGFVFIHVPKAAGTSLREVFGLKAPLDTPAHAHARDVLPFIKSVAPDAISIAFVRNPYTRFLSLYNFARQEETPYTSVREPERAPYGKHVDFELLKDKSLDQCAELLIEGKLSGGETYVNIWHPQVNWVTNERGKIMVDYIGHVESMPYHLRELRERYGITCGQVPWLNKSDVSKSQRVMTDRARDLVRLYYKRDFEMLNYSEQCPSELSPSRARAVLA